MWDDFVEGIPEGILENILVCIDGETQVIITIPGRIIRKKNLVESLEEFMQQSSEQIIKKLLIKFL